MSDYIGSTVDLETTGLLAGVHEIGELTILLHDDKFKPLDKFTTHIKPMRPELADPQALAINGLKLHELKEAATPPQVRNAFFQWHQEVAEGKKLFPMGHNYGGFDKGFLRVFLGDYYDDYFHYKHRDTFSLAQGLKDGGLLDLEQNLSLEKMCEHFHIPYVGHRSYDDAVSTLILYRKLISLIKRS